MSFFKSYEEKLKEEERKQDEYKKKIMIRQAELEAKKQLKEEKQNTVKAFSIMQRTKVGWWKAFKNNMKERFFSTKVMLIHMELRNGFHIQFIAKIRQNEFSYDKGTYIIDDDLKYYDMSAKMWSLDYHQDIAVPVLRKVPVSKIKKAIETKGITDIDTAINPITLKQFIESEVIQKVMKGEEMDKVFKFLKFMLILNVLISAVTAIVILQSSGILAGLRIPGIS